MAANEIDRRELLKAGVASVSLLAAEPAKGAVNNKRDPGLIQRENAKPGAKDWQLTNVKIDKRGYRSNEIEGYCSHQSVESGQKLQVMVSANPAGPFELEIFRMGYYGGRGARLMRKMGPFEAKAQPVPPVGENRLRECRWEPTLEFTVPEDWPSGVYLGAHDSHSGQETHAWQSYIVFIVRDQRPADILFQCADNTWQAYNRWPDNYSLYTDPRGAWSRMWT